MFERQIDHSRPVPNLRAFRVYLSTQDPGKNAAGFVLYRDTPIRGKALIDPFIYEHASWGAMELRVAVFKVNGSETAGPHYGWQRIGNVEEDLEVWSAWVSLAETKPAKGFPGEYTQDNSRIEEAVSGRRAFGAEAVSDPARREKEVQSPNPPRELPTRL